MLRNIFQKLLLKILPANVIWDSIQKKKVEACEAIVIIGKKSTFYPEAKVFNLKKDKDSIEIGDGTHIRGELLIFANGGKIKIGSNTYIGEGTRIWSATEVRIGDNVLISHNCNIIDTDSHELDHLERAASFKKLVETGHSREKTNVLTSPIHIDDYAWLSYNVSILKGIKIGKGAIIGAGSIVTKDVPDFTIVAGNPAVFIKKLS